MVEGYLKSNRGFSLVEALLAGAIFSLLTTALIGSFLYGQEATVLAGKRARASFLASEGLAAAHNIKDENFNNLVDGRYGLAIVNNQWNFVGSPDVVDIFTRELEISTVNTNTKKIISNVAWQQNLQRNGLVSLTTYLSNWDSEVASSTCGQYCQEQGYATGICRQNIQQCGINNETYEIGGDPYCLNSSQADTCCCLEALPVDQVSPAAINDLALSGATTNSINLSWTAPGDDGNIGAAASYEIRYSRALITEANWASATQIAGAPAPLIAGSAQTVTVSGLAANTIYYFAIKTSDEVPNTSAISNAPSLATLNTPITTCAEFCQSLNYSLGTCRKNPATCKQNGETNQVSGNIYCADGKNADTCCCAP